MWVEDVLYYEGGKTKASFGRVFTNYDLTLQRGRSGLRDANADSLANAVVSAVEDDHFVLLRAAEELFAAALADTFDEDVVLLSDAALVGRQAQFVLEGDEFVEAANLRFLGHVVG